MDEIFGLYEVLKSYGPALRLSTDIDIIGELVKSISEKDPMDFFRILTALTHIPTEVLLLDMDDPVDSLEVLLNAFRDNSISEVVQHGIALGIIE